MTYDIKDFTVWQRVQLHPATDLWMKGARFGEIVSIGKRYLHVRLDATGKIVRLAPRNVCEIVSL